MKKELWLEFGFRGRDGWHDMVWYNEGNWREFPYFLKKIIEWRNRDGVYFLWRLGKKKHYLRSF